MRNVPAWLSGIPLCLGRIPEKQTGYFPYDGFSPTKLARNLCIANARILELNTNKIKRTEQNDRKKDVENVKVGR